MGVTFANMPSLSGSNVRKTLLDLVFRDCCLILSDLGAILGLPWGAAPVVGFSFQHPSSLGLLKYAYSEYPYLTRDAVANSLFKESTSITIRGLRPITKGNSIVINTAFNTAVVKLLEKYADCGGRFTLMTMWGPVTNLVLESLDGSEEEGQGGVAFDFTFKKIYVKESLLGAIASALQRL